jgi:beta propeller repeat protein
MKQVTVFGVVVLITMYATAAIDVFPVCTSSGNQRYPTVGDNAIIWQDERNGNRDIYGYDLITEQEFVICTASGHQQYPKISGSIIVWQDGRNSSMTGNDIYGYNRLSQQEFAICTASGGQQFPAISNGIVVWYDTRNSATGNDIYGYDIAGESEFVICDDEGSQVRPAIDGNWVVWLDNRSGTYQLYGCQLVLPASLIGYEIVPLSPSGYEQGYPSISGNIVVWHEQRSEATGYDIYGFRLDTREEFLICSAAGWQINPVVYGDLVIWQDERNGNTRTDIFGYDFSSGSEFIISAPNANQINPSVRNRLAAWQHNDDIYAARMPLPTVISVLVPNGGEMLQAGSEFTIEWQTEGPALEQVRIAFSSDAGDSWQVAEPNVPDSGTYVWTAPDVNSQSCLVRISDIGGTGAADSSDAVFTVFRCDPLLTADLTGDCRVDVEDFAVMAEQWLRCGNLYDESWCSK